LHELPAPDPLFRVVTLAATANPHIVAWQALHQDYSEGFVADEMAPSGDDEAGAIVVNRLLKGGRGHFGPLEHPQITLAVGGFPHEVMQQARTHRVACSFDVQSGRYTGGRVVQLARGERVTEEVFYFRPVGEYTDRQGKRYVYTEEDRHEDLEAAWRYARRYARRIEAGYAEEHARANCPYAIRQNFVVSFNARSLMHFLDLRGNADAQQEIRQLSALMLRNFQEWMPALAYWYANERYTKARFAP
jgi:thymidylate synthase (FAD)